MQDEEEAELSLDSVTCASLYNRIIRIGFDGSQRAQRGRLVKNWFTVWRDHPRTRECREAFPEPFRSFLEQVEVIVDQDDRPPKRDALVQHLEPVSSPDPTTLWQQGDCLYYVPHSTRLATMLNQWRVLVEVGVWTVGMDGVEGGVDFYRQAKDVDKTEWFCLRNDCFDLSEVDFDA